MNIMRSKMALFLAFSFALLISCQSNENGTERINATMIVSPTPVFLQDHGVLYIRSEYHQAQMGLSIVQGGGEFQSLTTSYEWWVNVDNLQQVRRVTTEWLEDGPHIVAADGSNGSNGWWQVDLARGIPQVVYDDGQTPFALPNLDAFLEIFSRSGKKLVEDVETNKAEQVNQFQQAPWGKVVSIRKTDPQTGQTITALVRVEPPNILIERVVSDKDGNLFETIRITNWEWLDPATLDLDFWMNPPADVPIGASHP
ncbi:MAG: hypothetical protein HXY42_00615 [Chloroflexi bacterium]|nr:hypothetical protein [Chloroflexota bacterium]